MSVSFFIETLLSSVLPISINFIALGVFFGLVVVVFFLPFYSGEI